MKRACLLQPSKIGASTEIRVVVGEWANFVVSKLFGKTEFFRKGRSFHYWKAYSNFTVDICLTVTKGGKSLAHGAVLKLSSINWCWHSGFNTSTVQISWYMWVEAKTRYMKLIVHHKKALSFPYNVELCLQSFSSLAAKHFWSNFPWLDSIAWAIWSFSTCGPSAHKSFNYDNLTAVGFT